jgi:group I intron endonuclease
MMIVYKIVNNINEKIYIGISKYSLSERVAGHVRDKSYIGNALRKYGFESFTLSVIDEADSIEILKEKEKYWIKKLNSKAPSGYNLTDGGDGLINPAKEVRKEISDTLKKHYKNHPPTSGFTGHTHSEESKAKTSKSLIATMSKPEVKRKLSRVHLGVPKSEEHKKRISEAKTGKKRADTVWNKGLKMKDVNPNYVNPMQGKNRPDLSERNRERSKKS